MTLHFDSTRFGPLEIDGDAVIEFPAGLIGLGGARYALVATDAEASRSPGPALRRTHPGPWRSRSRTVVGCTSPTYAARRSSDADAARIGTGDAAEIDVWVTVRAAGELSDFSCNLRAPIVIWNGQGHQVINEAPDAPVRAPLFPEAAAVQAA